MIRQLTNNPLPILRLASLGIAGLLLVILAGGFWVWSQTNCLLTLPETEAVFEISQGTGLSSIAEDLQQRGWISSALALRIYGRLTSGQGSVKAGEYLVSADMTPRSLLNLLRSGQVIQHRFTIIEGWTFARIRQALAEERNLQQSLGNLPAETIMDRLGIDARHPEGYFFPDTYQFAKGTSDFSILVQSYLRMTAILAQEWRLHSPDLPYQSAYEALIMASIVEKETGLEADRTKIAAVFVRRLRQGMRLQSDPTVIYGMGSDYNGNLRKKDLQNGTPYNTYVNKGLPPTPICSPGLSSIRSALFPADISSLYFVSRGDGSSKFSDTLEEHNQAVKQYQIMENR
jgi:UPF0755 protein